MRNKVHLLGLFFFTFIVINVTGNLSAGNKLELRLLSSEYLNYNVFYISDIDPDNSSMQPEILRFQIENLTDEPLDYTLRLSIDWNGSTLLYPHQGIITPTQPLEPYQILDLTNRDVLTSGNPYFSSNMEINDLFNNNKNFESLILKTSKLPDGEYHFQVAAYLANQQVIQDAVNLTLNITSPTAISLLTPGVPYSEGYQNIFNQHPQFSWFSNLADFIIKVYEVPENLISLSQLENTTPFFTNEVSSTTFNYPVDGPILLPDTVYAWRVLSGLLTPLGSGQNIEKSDFFFFMITGEEDYLVLKNTLITVLNSIDIENASEISNLLQNEGFNLTGGLRMNHSNIGVGRAERLLNRILSNQLNVIQIELVE